jgi:hypothetical protein
MYQLAIRAGAALLPCINHQMLKSHDGSAADGHAETQVRPALAPEVGRIRDVEYNAPVFWCQSA